MRDVILFLDDSSERAALAYSRMKPEDRSSTFWCTTVAEAIGVLNDYRHRLYRVFLDHDLGNPEDVSLNLPMHSASEESGMEAVRFLEKQNPADYKDCTFIIHSHNPYAAQKMTERLQSKGYDAHRIPFGT